MRIFSKCKLSHKFVLGSKVKSVTTQPIQGTRLKTVSRHLEVEALSSGVVVVAVVDAVTDLSQPLLA